MDSTQYIDGRYKLYMGHTLRDFEQKVERLLDLTDSEVAEAVARFKANCRANFKALGVDAKDILASTTPVHVNGYAVETRDRLANGRA